MSQVSHTRTAQPGDPAARDALARRCWREARLELTRARELLRDGAIPAAASAICQGWRALDRALEEGPDAAPGQAGESASGPAGLAQRSAAALLNPRRARAMQGTLEALEQAASGAGSWSSRAVRTQCGLLERALWRARRLVLRRQSPWQAALDSGLVPGTVLALALALVLLQVAGSPNPWWVARFRERMGQAPAPEEPGPRTSLREQLQPLPPPSRFALLPAPGPGDAPGLPGAPRGEPGGGSGTPGDPRAALSRRKADGTPWNAPGNLAFDLELVLPLGGLRKARSLELSLSGRSRYRVVLERAGEVVQEFEVVPVGREGLVTHSWRLSGQAASTGIDRIIINLVGGGDHNALGHLLLLE